MFLCINIYFKLRFGYVNLIENHLWLEIVVCGAGEGVSLKCLLIDFAIPNLSLIFICIYKSAFGSVFSPQNNLLSKNWY